MSEFQSSAEISQSHAYIDLSPQAIKEQQAVKNQCCNDRHNLAQEVEQQKVISLAKSFDNIFGIENRDIVIVALTEFQSQCTEDITAYPVQEILACIREDIDTKILESRQDTINAHSVKTERQLDSDNVLLERENADFSHILQSKLEAIGNQDIQTLAKIHTDIRDKGQFSGKNENIIVIDNLDVAKAILERIADIQETMAVIQTHFLPTEQAIIQNAQINLAGNSTREIYAASLARLNRALSITSEKRSSGELSKKS